MSARIIRLSQKSLGSMHAGLGEWLLQRLTALYMSGYVLYFMFRFSFAPVSGFAEWQSLCASGAVGIFTALFIAAALVHAWIGLRSVYIDYLRPAWVHFTILALTGVALLALAFWSAQLLFAVSL